MSLGLIFIVLIGCTVFLLLRPLCRKEDGKRASLIVALIIATGLPILSIGLYGFLGSPELALPRNAEADAIMAMTPEQQKAMINNMVERLAAKMEKSPEDKEGWQRLAKAYHMLGEEEKAKAAELKAGMK